MLSSRCRCSAAAAALGLLAAWLGAGAVAPQCEAATTVAAASNPPPAGVPSLDEMAGEWFPATLLRDTPAISNWAGSVGTNADVVDATSFIVPPLTGGPSMLRLRVDGKDLKLDAARWSVYEATRRSQPLAIDAHALTVTSQLRMAFNDSALLWKISVTNRLLEGVSADDIDYEDIVHSLEFSAQAIARQFDEMGWLLTEPPRSARLWDTTMVPPTESGNRAMVLHEDPESDAVSGFVFADHQPSQWTWFKDPQLRNRSAAVGLVDFFVAPGETASMRVVAAMGSSTHLGGTHGMARKLDDLAARFDEHFEAARTEWERVWAEAFTPPAQRVPGRPPLFSGHLPVLHTEDAAVRRLYYMGALSLLATGRTSVAAFDDDPDNSTGGGGGGGHATYITGFGNTCWTRGDLRPSEVDCLKPASPRDTILEPTYIGATAQFYWDTSLRALLTALLDPAALRRYIVKMMSLPSGTFERSFGLDALNGAPIGYEYAFNSHSIFTIVGTYLRATNDTALLGLEVDDGITLEQRLEAVALDWVRRRLPEPPTPGAGDELVQQQDEDDDVEDKDGNGDAPVGTFALWPWDDKKKGKGKGKGKAKGKKQATAASSSSSSGEEDEEDEDGPATGDAYLNLADYGGDINTFLECVPTYLHATPALQGGNAEMMAWMASLRAAQGNATGAQQMGEWARAIAADTVEHLYVKGGEGVWGCLYPDYTLTPVRHVLDFIYVSRGLAVVGEAGAAAAAATDAAASPLPARVSGQMSFFFHDELETPSWLRALSPYDRLNLRVPRPKSILRPDHGITGAFDAWAALAAEALAINDGRWDGALTVLRHMAATTKEGPFGQAHEINDMDLTAFKTKRGFTRYAADNGGSFSDVIVRGLFGYSPPFMAQRDTGRPFQGLEAAIAHAQGQPRGDLRATLANLPTPWGLATLQLGPDGVSIVELIEPPTARPPSSPSRHRPSPPNNPQHVRRRR